MSAEQVRETLQQYVEVLLARGEYGRFFDDDIEFALRAPTTRRGVPRWTSRRSATRTSPHRR